VSSRSLGGSLVLVGMKPAGKCTSGHGATKPIRENDDGRSQPRVGSGKHTVNASIEKTERYSHRSPDISKDAVRLLAGSAHKLPTSSGESRIVGKAK